MYANEVINEAKFYYWQKKLRESKLPAQSFIPIVLGSHSPNSVLSCTSNVGAPHSATIAPEYKVLYSYKIYYTPEIQ